MRIPLLILHLVCAASAWACACFSAGNACAVLRKTDIVFLGRVIEDSGAEAFGTTAGKVAVEEVLHGLPPETRELYVNTGAGSSCYWRLQKGERYVIFASRGTAVFGAGGIFSGPCDSSFPLEGNEKLFAALRNAERGGAARLVGRVWIGPSYLEKSAPRLLLEATGADRRFTTYSDGNGEFEFLTVAPGRYRLAVKTTGLFDDQESRSKKDLVVGASGCDIESLQVWPDGGISGSVQNADGKPVSGVPVQAFIKTRIGDFDSVPLREQKTAAQSRFALHGLPPGDIIVGINGELYSDRLPWPPTFHGGPAGRDTALPVKLEWGQQRQGIDLRLPPPRRRAQVRVEVVLEGGNAATSPGVKLEDSAGIERVVVRPHGHRGHLFTLPAFAGETYVVKGWQHLEEGSWEGETGPFTVTGPEKRVRVVLHEKKR